MTEAEKVVITKYDLYYEQRMTKVESAIESLVSGMTSIVSEMKEIRKDMRSDFRWLLGIILGSNAGLFALMAHGFKWFA